MSRLVLGLSARQTPILTYHAVAERVDPRFAPYAVTPAELEQQLGWLRDRGYRFLTVADYARALQRSVALPERTVVLTFDDAFADFRAVALPLLQRYGAVATLYVPTAFVGGTSRWAEPRGEGARALLDWDGLRTVRDAGVEIGGHAHTHRRMAGLSDAEIVDEVGACKAALEAELDAGASTFAYPFGDHDRRVRRAVRDAGYDAACEVRELPSTSADDPYALRRLLVLRGTSPERFRALVERRAGPGRRLLREAKAVAAALRDRLGRGPTRGGQ